MDSLNIKRYQKAFQQGHEDASLNKTFRFEIAEDQTEYEYYIKGRKYFEQTTIKANNQITSNP